MGMVSESSALEGCKITYFPLAGRGETSRIMLSAAGVQYDDERINFAQWRELKPQTKWGSMPFLTLADGSILGQTRALQRFIATQTGFYPSDDILLAAKIDELVDAVEDLPGVVNAAGRDMEQAYKEAERRAVVGPDGRAGILLGKIDKCIGDAGATFAVGDVMTLADIAIFTQATHIFSGFFD